MIEQNREALQARWKYLCQSHLPKLAKARDPSQKTWPVYLDHCFARIVLDNAVGVDRPWTEIVRQPAVKNMSSSQLEAAVALAEEVAAGDVDLVRLDSRSLELRGKKQKRKAKEVDPTSPSRKKQRRTDGNVSSYFESMTKSSTGKQKPKHEGESEPQELDRPRQDEERNATQNNVDMSAQVKRITESDITPFRKQMLSLLCQVPRGQYSTYQAMSDYISATSHKTCARAVGSAMRNNPFAPEVPCHRILASDGSLGGFGGHWGEEGKFANKKHELLFEEGVRFDSRGKVKGPPFRDFTT